MKRLLALLAGGIGLRALFLRSRPAPAVSPADDLRAKLAETKVAQPEAEPERNGRRADVHARARQAIDDLRDDS